MTHPKKLTEEALKRLRLGETSAKIARDLNIPAGTIRYWKHKGNVPLLHRPQIGFCVSCGEFSRLCGEGPLQGRCKLYYSREHYQRNHKKTLERQHQHRKKNYERVREGERRSHRKLKKENPERYKRYNRRGYLRYKTHKRGMANTLTLEQLEFERRIGEATYQTKRLDLHHIVPLSRGGGHTWGNIIFIPPSLNGYIQDKLPEEVYKQLSLSL